ncbi:hypothetical protein [Spirulina subsalsa]|uniref:hypothetical protein n=1 Tax=Spirulina subsalsa TaxID=54311 RepID=UPI00038141F6|nr:hypothetical protein [Spirulina subsalsa]
MWKLKAGSSWGLRERGVGSRELGVGSRESGIGKRQKAKGKSYQLPLLPCSPSPVPSSQH